MRAVTSIAGVLPSVRPGRDLVAAGREAEGIRIDREFLPAGAVRAQVDGGLAAVAAGQHQFGAGAGAVQGDGAVDLAAVELQGVGHDRHFGADLAPRASVCRLAARWRCCW
jgi:hypothetical protein